MTAAALPPLPVRDPGTQAPRPRDAASVVIWRRWRNTTQVLMGKRHSGHSFMPQRHVFPGGRVDGHDARVRSATEMTPTVAGQLARTTPRGRGRSIAVAAVRETFEETGLVIGAKDPRPHRPPPRGWQPFFATGMAPRLDCLLYIARAITPSFRPVRFDARFFMVNAAHVQGKVRGSGELEDLDWISLGNTGDLELAQVTRAILDYAAELLSGRAQTAEKIPFFKHVPGDIHTRIYQ